MSSKSAEILDIFSEAVAIQTPVDQSAYLAGACGSDTQFRSRIEALLQAHSVAGGFLGGQSAAQVTTMLHGGTETINAVIGRYTLREVLGTGGMGIVYAAEQTDPLRREVALKVIKPGMDSREVLARFDAERQALALMNHPGIAHVYDAGTTDVGHPYFVMELVRGLPITDYCDRYRLSPGDRLKLFISVCQAVHHAHLKGIIHRDLKPSNVLVAQQDGAPTPKVIDFGVAKATTAQRLTDRTLYTQQALLLGTPLYMSPEQAELSGVEIDARSDVYALGVMLYELLTGSTPFDKARLSDVSFDELRRIIREDDPPCPSQKLSTLTPAEATHVAAGRSIDERQLRHCLHGNLDWIIMKALAKDRTRRYESAAALAADVRRYLDHEPVIAGPPSWLYRSREFARGYYQAVIGTAALAVLAASFYFQWLPKLPEGAAPESAETVLGETTTSGPEDVTASISGSTTAIAAAPESDQSPTVPPTSDDRNPPPDSKARDPITIAQGEATPESTAGEPPDTAAAPPVMVPLAVFPFEERGVGATGYGTKISDFLLASLAGNPDLIVVERAELNKALDEQKLTASGLVKPDEAVQVGKLTGAKLIILGSIVELDSTLLLSARITSTETGRIAGAKVKGKTSDDLAELADQLATEVLTALTNRQAELIPKPVTRVDRLAAIKKALGDQPRPTVWVQVTEEHVGQATIDPAAETELAKLLEDSGFTVIDHKDGNRKQADVILEGEAFSEFATRHNDLISVKARVEVKAVRAATGERIASDRQTEIVVDVAEQVAGKTALQNAAAEIASRLLPRLATTPAK